MIFTEIKAQDLSYTNTYGSDRLYSKLILTDTDWMNYKLITKFTTKKHGQFHIVFEFFGADFSIMNVKCIKRQKTCKSEYTFSTDIFQKYIVRYLSAQIAAWRSDDVFYAEPIILDFYNQVIKQHYQK